MAVGAGAAGDRVYYTNAAANNAFAILPVNDFGTVEVGAAGPFSLSLGFVFTTGGTLANGASVGVQGVSKPGVPGRPERLRSSPARLSAPTLSA